MGLGKSAQAIAAADETFSERVAVVCPAIARRNWLKEFEKFSIVERNFQIMNSGKTKPDPRFSIITSYEIASILHTKKAWGEQRFDALIVDEGHFLKSIDAKRTKAVLGKHGLVRRAERTWLLTGTPMPNHPGELWPLLFTFGITKLDYRAFLNRFCLFAGRGNAFDPMMQITGANPVAIPELRAMVRRFSLRRMASEVLKELPSITYGDVVVEPGEVDMSQFNNIARELKVLGDEITVEQLEICANSLSTLRKLVGAQKLAPVAKMVAEELDQRLYPKIVIFCVHQMVVEGLASALARFNPVVVYGKTRREQRENNIKRFQEDVDCQVFIGNIRAAGTAITLTAANQVLFAEMEWVPGDNAQAAKRCHRIGQRKPVFVRFVALTNSLDQKIVNILGNKTRDITAVLDAPEITAKNSD